MINVLAYELVVLDSIKTAEDLKGKSIGISRFGSVSDVAARELLKGLGLRPMEDVKILQVGGASERAAGFSRGVIAGFPSPPGNVHLIPGGVAASHPCQHGGSEETVSIAVHLRGDNQKLPGEESVDREKSDDGADRSDRITSRPTRRARKKSSPNICAARTRPISTAPTIPPLRSSSACPTRLARA